MSGRGLRVYERPNPKAEALHGVVRDNLSTFLAAMETGEGFGFDR